MNAKAFRAQRELRIMFAAWNLCVLCRLRPTLIAPKLYPYKAIAVRRAWAF